jgi:bifunctional polynucleotide phosphatase/kinase
MMWHALERHFSSLKTEIDASSSFYIGDAAGRPVPKKPRAWSGDNDKDFSDSDRNFGFNAMVQFQTPEEFFLGEPAEDFVYTGFDAVAWRDADLAAKSGLQHDATTVAKGEQLEMVLMVGCQASGKSTFSKNFCEKFGACLCLSPREFVSKCVHLYCDSGL